MPEFPSFASLENGPLIEEQYQRYLADPASVDASWRAFFSGVDFGTYLQRPTASSVSSAVDAFRRYGHLLAAVNPLEPPPEKVPELDLSSPEAPALKAIYCNRIGYEYMDLSNPELEAWMQERIEKAPLPELSREEKEALLNCLNKAEVFEAFMHTRYVGQTRFSLEGGEALIPLIGALLDQGKALGVADCTIGIAHRGRLNVLANILNKPYATIFQEFEDDTALSLVGNDDVRYHMAFSGEYKGLTVSMTPNPSHLESVDPVTLGQTRAKRVSKKAFALLVHGEAALSGQGVVYETLQMGRLKDYSVGGTIHIVINNQIGFTTTPKEGRSTKYCTDIAKTFGAPVFHVNGEDPESCVAVARLAMEIRDRFGCDVFIDLICYRKYGHNEGDEPAFTQPLEYKTIRAKKSVRQLYAETLSSQGLPTMEAEFKERLKAALAEVPAPVAPKTLTPEKDVLVPFVTRVAAPVLKGVLETFCTVPPTFHLHPKLQKWLQDRRVATRLDWATAECLAFGSLVKEKVPIRLAGQDVQRGTFSQRHLIWTDTETGQLHNPLGFDVVNSFLSEFAVLGFEYGYSCAWPQAFVLWEAQYGDFSNGAQIIIDQYIVSAEQKWDTSSSLTLLLPHAFEGAGPEHSSARIERFLQLAANNNIQVVYPTTPAQYFHLLRRQALRPIKKPLIVFTPKSLLRAPACTSSWEAFTAGQFEEILDEEKQGCKSLILCSGKVYYDILAERDVRKRDDVAIARVEQLYPLHKDKLRKVTDKYKKMIWVQEEPENMGAWNFMSPHLPGASHVGRPANATPATGSHKKHKQEQKILLDQAFGAL